MNSKDLSQLIIRGMQEKKAEDIVLIDLRKVRNAVADYFVICTGNSENQIDAITQSVEDEVYKVSSEHPWHKEGLTLKEWVLLDYADVVCHILKKDRRAFYQIEELWGDAIIEKVELEVQ